MQQEISPAAIHAVILSVEWQTPGKLVLLQQYQDVLLREGTEPETVDSCLDPFLQLQQHESVPLRRFLAAFLEKVVLCKPGFALRCLPVVAALVKDHDEVVTELAVKAAAVLHGRVLYLLALVDDGHHFQRYHNQVRSVNEAVETMLADGCRRHVALFQAAVSWARMVVLAQTPSPLLLRSHVPAELRGVRCLQDFPDQVHHLDLAGLRKHAEDLLAMVCRLLEGPPDGAWRMPHFAALLHCTSAVGRQRPVLFGPIIAIWDRLFRCACEVLSGTAVQSKQSLLPVAVADASSACRLIWTEAQSLLASGLASQWHVQLAEMLLLPATLLPADPSDSSASRGSHAPANGVDVKYAATGTAASTIEAYKARAKYTQIREFTDQGDTSAGDDAAEPKQKRPRTALPRKVRGVGRDNEETLHEDAFDEDALLCGESDEACRRFEEYFGLPSHREPAGHVPGPALLATRVRGNSELARLALTSLNSLAEKRSLLRDKAQERAVNFNAVPQRKPQPAQPANLSRKCGKGAADLTLFLSQQTPGVDELPAGQQLTEDRKLRKCSLPPGTIEPSEDVPPPDGKATQLPGDPAQRDGLQLLLFEEILEAQKRMEASLLAHAMSKEQLAGFELLSRRVALRIVSGVKLPMLPKLQREMCRCFMARAFDCLKAGLDGKAAASSALAAGGASVGSVAPSQHDAAAATALTKFVELFFAKYTADVARWQEAHGLGQAALSDSVAKTPLQTILEGTGGGEAAEADDASGGSFSYAQLFDMFIAEFERREIPRRELRTFLGELPAVPLSAFRMLEAQCQQSSEKARKIALLTVLSLIEVKPACRWHGFSLLFRLVYSGKGDNEVRLETIKLILNKIYSATPRPPMRWQLPHLSDAEAEAAVSVYPEAASVRDPAAEDLSSLPLQRLRGRCVEDVATLMLRSVARGDAEYRFEVRVPPRVDNLRGELCNGAVCVPKDRVWLYLALCIKRPVLLHELVETFTKCDDEMKEHLINSIEEAIKHIPVSEPELLVLVQKATPITERLVLKVLHILMQSSQGRGESLSPEYGAAVTKLYQTTQNPRLLVPVFDLLDRRCLLDCLPAVLQLEAEQVTDAFRLLIRSKGPPLTIAELLTELHHMNKPSDDIIPVACSIRALNAVFEMRDQFDTKVYGIVIQSLVTEEGPLPTLFMRTIIQVVKELPRLQDFIVRGILPLLVRQEVWADLNLWRGFMLVLEHTFASQPAGLARVLAMLPSSQLEDVLVQHPDWMAQLRDFVARQPPGSVPPHVRLLLQ